MSGGDDPVLLPLRFDRWQTVTVSWKDDKGALWIVNLEPLKAYEVFQNIPAERVEEVKRDHQWHEYFNGRAPFPEGVTKDEVKRYRLGKMAAAEASVNELFSKLKIKKGGKRNAYD